MPGFGIVLQSAGSYLGNIAVNASTGVVQLSNARPVGTHAIVLGITDSCGATRDASLNLTVRLVNTAPSFVAGATVVRQQGSPAGDLTVIGTVSDTQTLPQNISVTQIFGGSALDIALTDLVNNAGVVSARIAAGCNAQAGTIRLQLSDGTLSSAFDLPVSVTSNTPPVLGSYADTQILLGASAQVTPSAAPSDNGQVSNLSISLTPNSFTGSFNVATPNAQVSFANAAPEGNYSFVITARDNCNASSSRNGLLNVSQDFANGFEGE
ncbi:hypothetical protein HC761_01725 [bacterium]|nr:hypothetical protein [bacterium]